MKTFKQQHDVKQQKSIKIKHNDIKQLKHNGNQSKQKQLKNN